MTAMLRIGLVAGELSGDQLGAALMQRIRQRHPETHFCGICGPSMRAAGCTAFAHAEELAVMGFTEVLGQLPRLLRLRRHLLRCFLEQRPQLFLGIDAPDFNLGLEKRLKQHGIDTLHWVSPSVWAWRRYRLRAIRHSVDSMLTLFPFEATFYRDHGVQARWVGHPLADEIADDCGREAARAALGLAVSRPCVALLPGSRKTEIERLLPAFLEAATLCRRAITDLQFVLPVAAPALLPRCRATVQQPQYAELGTILLDGQARSAMCAADAVLLASGTASLECLLLKRPMVVAYRLHPVSYLLVRGLLQVPYVSLPNNLLGRGQVPEFLQSSVTAEHVSTALLELLQDPAAAARQVEPFAALHESLRRDATGQVADAVLERICAQ